jgi:hypothetical protein
MEIPASYFDKIVIISILFAMKVGIYAHGRLMDPPARNSMWRFGFANPINYNDNELFCGGFKVQVSILPTFSNTEFCS